MPPNGLELIMRNSKEVQFVMAVRKVSSVLPGSIVSSLPAKAHRSRSFSWPRPVGTDPVNLLFDRVIVLSIVEFERCKGISPVS